MIKVVSFTLIFSLVSCSNSKKILKNQTAEESNMGNAPSVIVYKTKKNYIQNVPIILSKNKETILSYPSPKDLISQESYLYPIKLKKGYLLDKKGINTQTAFLNMNYLSYSRLLKSPNVNELYKLILDKDPMLEIYDCGNRYNYNDLKNDLNQIINKGLLKNKCKQLK